MSASAWGASPAPHGTREGALAIPRMRLRYCGRKRLWTELCVILEFSCASLPLTKIRSIALKLYNFFITRCATQAQDILEIVVGEYYSTSTNGDASSCVIDLYGDAGKGGLGWALYDGGTFGRVKGGSMAGAD